MDILNRLEQESGISRKRIEAAVKLLDEGNTVPFIARYRKEVTGSMDDTELRALSSRLEYLRSLERRREEIGALIAAQEKLTPKITEQLAAAETLTELEDIYRPFRPHRKTRASVAKERGLAPLADLIAAQEKIYDPPIEAQAKRFLSAEKGVMSEKEALDGACDILAEEISDDAECRKQLRALTAAHGILRAHAAKEEDSVYANYYAYSELLRTVANHRVLAINRGEKEGFLKTEIEIDRDLVLNALQARVIRFPRSPAAPYLMRAMVDSYDRLIAPSVAREVRAALTERANESAIAVFSDNLRHLLLQPPLKGKTVLGFDPGYRTGCKLAVVDRTGKVLDTAVIYPTKPREQIEASEKTVLSLIKKYDISLISVGNGTASKESELFIANLLKKVDRPCKYLIVSEAGASVYSASELAAKEFPDFDVTQRSAVSLRAACRTRWRSLSKSIRNPSVSDNISTI